MLKPTLPDFFPGGEVFVDDDSSDIVVLFGWWEILAYGTIWSNAAARVTLCL